MILCSKKRKPFEILIASRNNEKIGFTADKGMNFVVRPDHEIIFCKYIDESSACNHWNSHVADTIKK